MIKKKNFNYFLFGLIALIAIVLIGYGIFVYPKQRFMMEIEEKVRNFNPYVVNDCELLMAYNDLDFALCTRTNHKTVLKDKFLNCSLKVAKSEKCFSDKFDTKFKPGEYLGLQVNLKRFEIPFETYYTCLYSNFPIYLTSYPKRYGEIKPGIYYPYFACSNKFNRNEYHHWALSGFVLDEPGKYIIAQIYVFKGSLPENFDFEKNLDKGIKIFELEGEISE